MFVIMSRCQQCNIQVVETKDEMFLLVTIGSRLTIPRDAIFT
jgi:hypothetical protein